ncbi:MAG: nuclear transport factor 2 family protein [Solirubrobacterales bacterium]
MSEENVEAFKRGIAAWNRGDIDATLEVFDPEVEWRPTFRRLLGGDTAVYRGRHGVREFLQDLDETWAELPIELTEIRDLGERIVAIGHLRGRGKQSGAELESSIGYVVEFKNGKVIRMDDYLDHQEALEAAGLSE